MIVELFRLRRELVTEYLGLKQKSGKAAKKLLKRIHDTTAKIKELEKTIMDREV
jgi:hypothetical protein